MQRRKSTPADDVMLMDENADPVERSSAIARLAVDGFDYFELTLATLLNHSNSILRGEAIKVLLGAWQKPKYFDRAIQMLLNDPEKGARSDAAHALSAYARRSGKMRDEVIKVLLESLLQDNKGIQEIYYIELLSLLNVSGSYDYPSRRFNHNQDVNWELLKPYIEKYGLNKPE